MSLRILHVLDHSIPLHSGYTFRTLSILREQRQLGWDTFHLTSPKQVNCNLQEDVDGWHFYRTPSVRTRACRPRCDSPPMRLGEVVRTTKPRYYSCPFAGSQCVAQFVGGAASAHTGGL